jgi:hypothetical protein
MNRFSIAVLIASLSLGSLAFADTLLFNNPSGDLTSTTHTYTLDGINVVATGFNGGDLFGKNKGGDENGVGLARDPSGDDEIFFKSTGPQDFIQLDVLNLINAGFHNFQFEMGSSTGTEGWRVTACSKAGTAGYGPCPANASTVNGTSEGLIWAPANLSTTNHYLDFSSTRGNVLLKEIKATAAPEPRFYGALLAGMLALAGIVLRERHSAEKA